jgi:hypothetical protein
MKFAVWASLVGGMVPVGLNATAFVYESARGWGADGLRHQLSSAP